MKEWTVRFVVRLLIGLVLMICLTGNGITKNIPDNLWKGLIAEAVNQGYIGMYAVCCVVRNRIALDLGAGLNGLKRQNLESFVAKQGLRYTLMAKNAYRAVFERNGFDITFGATHFESTDFPKPKWAENMTETVRVGRHIFYK